MGLFEKAVEFAARVHAGQVDKAGEPYLAHVLRVAFAGRNDLEQTVGALHDVMEDCGVTRVVLRAGFGGEVTHLVGVLTRNPGEDYDAFIDRIIDDGNPVAIRVKLADLHDNMRLERLKIVGPADFARYQKYRMAAAKLEPWA